VRFEAGVRPSSVWQAVHAGLKICCWICVEKVTVGVGLGDDGLLLLLEQPTAPSRIESDRTPNLNLTHICIVDTPCCLTGHEIFVSMSPVVKHEGEQFGCRRAPIQRDGFRGADDVASPGSRVNWIRKRSPKYRGDGVD